jgi:hypothetical protein
MIAPLPRCFWAGDLAVVLPQPGADGVSAVLLSSCNLPENCPTAALAGPSRHRWRFLVLLHAFRPVADRHSFWQLG